MASATRQNPPWTWIAPVAGALVLSLAFAVPGMPGIVPLLVAGLFASVIAAVHHAEVIALKVGEPFGTIVLALAVTAITEDERLRRELLASPHVDRLTFGAVPTSRVSWDQPHEGNLFEHLYRRRAFATAETAA